MSASETPSAGPVTTAASSRTTSWRALAIGAVVLLALAIGAALGAYLMRGPGAQFGAAGSYVPAGSALYMELRVEPSSEQDAALRELLGRFPAIEGIDLGQPLADQLSAHLDEATSAAGSEFSWSEDVESWFDGTIAFAATEIPTGMPTPADPSASGLPPGFLLLLGVTDPAAANAAIDRAHQSAQDIGSVTETPYGEFAIREFAPAGQSTGTGVATVVTDDQLLVAATADDIRAALDAKTAGPSLADSEDFGDLTAGLPNDWLMWGVYDLTELMQASLTAPGLASPGLAGSLEELMAAQPMRGAFALSASGDRIAMDSATDLPSGPFAVENANRGLAERVPGDVLFYSDAGNIGTGLAAGIASLKETLAAEPMIGDQVAMVESALGADIEELVSWIGDGAMVIGWDGTEPYAGLVLVPNDAAAAARRLEQLATFARLASLDPSSGITLNEGTIGGQTVTTITWEDSSADPDTAPVPVPTGFVVEYTLTDEHALIGFGKGFVRRVLELAPEDSLAAQPRYADAVAELGGSSNTSVLWLDLTGARTALETAMEPMLGMMDPTGAYESDIRPWLEPLDRLVGVTRVDGDRLVSQAALLVD